MHIKRGHKGYHEDCMKGWNINRGKYITKAHYFSSIFNTSHTSKRLELQGREMREGREVLRDRDVIAAPQTQRLEALEPREDEQERVVTTDLTDLKCGMRRAFVRQGTVTRPLTY